MTSTIKVLFIIDSLRIGGAEKQLFYFLREVSKKEGFTYEVCTLYSGNGLYSAVQSLNVKVIDLGLKVKYSVFGLFKLIDILKKGSYDIVHVHLFPAQLYAAIASSIVRNPVFIYTEHSETNRRRNKFIFKILDKFQYKRFNIIIAVGDNVKRNLSLWQPRIANKIKVIKNAINTEDILLQRKNFNNYIKDIDILFIGRLIKEKGVDLLLNATNKAERILGRRIIEYIVGDGKDKDSLMKLAKKMGLENVVFVGLQKEIFEWMARSKILIFPSRHEGLPMALLEGMAFGMPIICTDVGDMGKIIINKENGILVPKENNKELCSAICSLLENEELRKKLGEAARRTVQANYDIKDMSKKLLELYKELV